MNEPWLIYFLIFATIFLLVQFVYAYATRDLKARRHINKRLADIAAGKHRPEAVVLARTQAGLGTSTSLQRLNALVVQAGVRATRGQLILVLLGTMLACFALSALLISSLVLAALLSLLGAPLLMLLVLRIKRKRRIARFAEQLPDVLDVIVRSLRAGHPLIVALGLSSRQMPDPSGSEFGAVSDEVAFGRSVQEAVNNLYSRVGYEDLIFFATAVSIQQQTGGNLAEILQRLSELLRERFKLRRKVRALSAEGRFSAIALTAFPFILVGIIWLIAPSYYGDEWGNPILTIAFSVSGLMVAIGNVVMYKMVNFKV